MIDYLLQLCGFIAAVVIFCRVEPILARMSPGCRLLVRLAFWALAVGAAAVILKVAQGYIPPFSVVLSLTGAALLLMIDRRTPVSLVHVVRRPHK